MEFGGTDDVEDHCLNTNTSEKDESTDDVSCNFGIVTISSL